MQFSRTKFGKKTDGQGAPLEGQLKKINFISKLRGRAGENPAEELEKGYKQKKQKTNNKTKNHRQQTVW